MPYRFNKRGPKSTKRRGELVDLNKLVKGKTQAKDGPKSPTSPVQTCPLSDLPTTAGNESVAWNGVKLSCVESRWFQVSVKDKRLSIDIGDYQTANSSDISVVLRESHLLQLPDNFQEKMVGKCTCIGSQGSHLIIQYQTPPTCAYSRFFFVDLDRRHVQLFEDAVKYFHWNSITKGPVECYISPMLQFTLFLLPMKIKSDRKWSKLLCSKITRVQNHYVTGDINEYGMDRRNQAVALYTDGLRIIYVIVDSFCSFCNIKTQQFSTKSSSGLRISLQAQIVKADTSSDEDENVGYDHLLQCSAAFCRSGDVIVLVCLVQNIKEDICKFQVNTYQICAISYRLLAVNKFLVPHSLMCHVIEVDLVTSYFSPCDSYFNVWFLKSQDSPVVSPKCIPIVKEPTLKSLCRCSIIKLLSSPAHIHDVMLPVSLQCYLRFK